MAGAGFGQIARERGDHQHGFEPFAQQDDGGLMNADDMNELCVSLVLSFGRFK